MTPAARADRLLQVAPAWLAALWWGSLTTIGFLVVPLLFAYLPTPALAGGMAARLFTAQTWVSLLCGMLLLLLSRRDQDAVAAQRFQRALLPVLAGMVLAALGEWIVAPHIVARDNLALWHRVGSGLYLLQWLCAGLSFWRLAAPPARTQV